ncbi:MAG: protoporphyrinogen oxidase [Chthoniobacterales bacterium]
MKSIAIVGAGITGLTAAFRLQQRGYAVTVYEAGSHVGGMINTIQQDGFLVECGPGTIVETSPQIGALVRDLGLESRRSHPGPNAQKNYIVRNGKPLPIPHSAFDMLATRLFSPTAKLRLLAEPFLSRAVGDENLADFVTRRLGREFLDYAINPFVAGVYAGDPKRLSVRHAFPKLHAVEQRYGSLIVGKIRGARERRRRTEKSIETATRFSFDGGLRVLTDTLSKRLGASIHLRSPVRVLTQTQSGWEVESDHTNGPVEHSAVVLAAPAHQLAKIVCGSREIVELAPLAGIHHPPVCVVALGFRREDVEHPLDGFGMLIPEVEKRSILGTTFSSSLFPERAPEGHVLLTNFIGGCRNSRLALRDADTRREATLQDLRELLGVKGPPVFEHQVLQRYAIPQYDVGFERFRKVIDHAEAEAPGLYFAGSYRDGISLGNSIVSGDCAAARVGMFMSETQVPSLL